VIALDTNVVLRLLVADDEDQAARVAALLEDLAAREERALLTDIVLCELEWALRARFGMRAKERQEVFRALFDDPKFAFESRDRVERALAAAADGSGDISDQLLGLRGADLGALTTYTFDRALRKDPRFTAI
jgi:predicted nucleic-acid-binding protein